MKKDMAAELELFFAALADKTRLRLLNLMRDGEVCVCFFAETLSTNNPKISRHLAYLKRAGLVTARRDGKWMHYRISMPADPNKATILKDVFATFDSDALMKKDKTILMKVCCAPGAPIQIQRALS